MKTLSLIFILAITAVGQDRIELISENEPAVAFSRHSFGFSSGPPTEPNYNNHTFALSYNSNNNGTKITSGLVNFGWAFEARDWTGTRFVSEGIFTWTSPDGQTTRRPFSFDVDHATNDVNVAIVGRMLFYTQQNTPWAFFNPDGLIDLRPAASGAIILKNNAHGLLFMKADNSNSIKPIGVDAQNRVVVSPWGYDILMGAPVEANTINATGDIKVDGLKVVGNRCGAIPDSTGTDADNQRAINALLTCLRNNHGLLG